MNFTKYNLTLLDIYMSILVLGAKYVLNTSHERRHLWSKTFKSFQTDPNNRCAKCANLNAIQLIQNVPMISIHVITES